MIYFIFGDNYSYEIYNIRIALIILTFVFMFINVIRYEIVFYKKSVEYTGYGELVVGTAYTESRYDEFKDEKLKELYKRICYNLRKTISIFFFTILILTII
jgi:hypothetical protein